MYIRNRFYNEKTHSHLEIISYRYGDPIAYIYAKTKHFSDNTFEGFTKYLTREEVDTYLTTGNWYKMTADRAKGDRPPHNIIVQIVEHNTPHVPSRPHRDSSVNTAEDEFSGLGLLPED